MARYPEGALDLRPRQREILYAVIREYIRSARPVSSAALVERYHMDLSTATVRNEFADLEELGLLTHPHTSAGRVPTDLGYRFFVEALMGEPELGPDEQVTLSHQFRQAAADATEWLRLAASALARVTAEAALATYDRVLEPAEVTWTREIHYEGIDRILAQPEFAAGERVREIVALLADRALLARVLPATLDEGQVAVTIGSENTLEPLRSFSLVVGRYGAAGPLGYVGVVGPRRMDYRRTIAAVRYVGALMSDLARAQ